MVPKRTAYTNAEKTALRRHHQTYPILTQKELGVWFEGQTGKAIKQVTISEVLSDRYAFLDNGAVSSSALDPSRKKQRQEQWLDLEEALSEWVVKEQHRLPITGDIIRTKASWFWHRLPQYCSRPEPPWSNGWLAGFKQRRGIKDRRRHGEASSVDDTTMRAKLAIVQARIATYSLEDQYNCDETGLFWEAIPDRALSTTQLPGWKQDKSRITFYFCVNASGSHKLKPWIIGRYQQPRCFTAAGVNISRLDCVYHANKKSWMTGVLMEQWLRWFDNQIAGRKVVLIMDNFSAHQAAVDAIQAVPSEFGLRNTEIVWLPPNTTSKTQPLDQGIVSAFKAIYRRTWLRYMLDEYEHNHDPMKTINLLKAIRFSIRAWHEVSSQQSVTAGSTRTSIHSKRLIV